MSKISRKTWITIVVSVVVILAIVLVVVGLRSQAAANSSSAYQTTNVTRGTLTSYVEGTGTIESLRSASLTWQTSGQVDQVNVKVGDQVKKDQVLATVGPSAQTQTSLETALVTAQENLAQLTSPEAIANAKIAVANDQADVIKAQSALNGLQYWQNQALIQDQYANLVIAKANLDKAQAAYDAANVGQYINNTGEAALYQALYNAQQKYNTAQYYYSLYSQKPTQRQYDEAQANLDLANATLTNDQNYLAALTGGTVPTDATGTSLLKLKQAQLSVESAQENLQNYLDSTQITAPFDGTITGASAILGDIVSNGTAAFTIDDLSSMVVSVNVIEVDINSVKVDQPATITFDAIPNKTYNGKVTQTNLAGTAGQNSVNFPVNVELTNTDALVKPGMSANVTITTNQVADALLVPSTAIFTANDGQPFVYLVQNGTLTEVPVTIGATSDTESQVTSNNLQAGESIVLSFASSSSSTTGGRGFGLFGGLGGGVRVQGGGNGGSNSSGGSGSNTNP
jgi:HlyD family secretion protein